MKSKHIKKIAAMLVCAAVMAASFQFGMYAAENTADGTLPGDISADSADNPDSQMSNADPDAYHGQDNSNLTQNEVGSNDVNFGSDQSGNYIPSNDPAFAPETPDSTDIPSDTTEIPSDPSDNTVFDDSDIIGSDPSAVPDIIFNVDWNSIAAKYPGADGIYQWSIIHENGGYYIWTSTGEYVQSPLYINYSDGSYDEVRLFAENPPYILNSTWNVIAGSYIQSYVENGIRFSEIFLPESFFITPEFTISSGSSISSDTITDRYGNILNNISSDLVTDSVTDTSPEASPISGFSINWSDYTQDISSAESNTLSAVRDNSNYYILVKTSYSDWYAPDASVVLQIPSEGKYYEQIGPYTQGISSVSQVFADEGYKLWELCVPVDMYPEDLVINIQNQQIPATSLIAVEPIIPVDPDPDPETDPDPEPDPEPKPYTGIIIDGDFSDWDSVPKYDIDNGGMAIPDAVTKAAMVWDGDYVYIMLETTNPRVNALASAGPNSNGNFAINTDAGYKQLLGICYDIYINQFYISGLPEAQLMADTSVIWDPDNIPHRLEIAIPTSSLPIYFNSIDFGLYLGDMPIKGVTNLNPKDEPDKEFNGIVIDGNYGDWLYYPHHNINYSGAGTGETVEDAVGALYSEGSTIYGHSKTTMSAHLAMNAWEVGRVDLSVNDTVYDPNTDFKSRLIYEDPETGLLYLDPNDMINQNMNDYYKPYHYYMIDTSFSVDIGSVFTKEQLFSTGAVYGDAYITKTPTSWDVEFEINADMLAQKAGIDPSDIKTINARFERLGDGWVTAAGTSTGAILGIVISIAAVGATYAYRRKKKLEIF